MISLNAHPRSPLDDDDDLDHNHKRESCQFLAILEPNVEVASIICDLQCFNSVVGQSKLTQQQIFGMLSSWVIGKPEPLEICQRNGSTEAGEARRGCVKELAQDTRRQRGSIGLNNLE